MSSLRLAKLPFKRGLLNASRVAGGSGARLGVSARHFSRTVGRAQEAAKPKAEPKVEPNAGAGAGAGAGGSSGGSGFGTFAVVLGAAAAGYYGYTQFYAGSDSTDAAAKDAGIKTFDDYKKVYEAIAKKLVDDDDYDDGSYGPVLVRLAWHASGSYSKVSADGGSGAGTMRFAKEIGYGANAGLDNGRKFLKSIHDEFPWLSHGDLYTLGGVVAIQELGGPTIPWRAGRVDQAESATAPDGRLPDASQESDHIRTIFYRMGFNDQEIVALIGAHALGRCHTQNSGYDGPWTFSPTTFTNDFFKLLIDEKWHIRKWDGPKQYEDDKTKSLMMLPADYALVKDKEFKKWVVKYANDSDLFFKDFAKAFSTLLELGVKFKADTPVWEFPTVNA
ncbi:Ccp1p [Sugiyamaella lignohabitans]|uniref:Peroxidase n=1 Tax=Sugiyamaella lignohabitans TaxID=796027 RepID=A0A167DS79_9ASCO|nr:Ccp1p [Sugiyamaella lignohabitans]ANB13229.1 Ccp1p [Sugiyamaella lignohabitans]